MKLKNRHNKEQAMSEDMNLPDGKTAISCVHFPKCSKMFGCRDAGLEDYNRLTGQSIKALRQERYRE